MFRTTKPLATQGGATLIELVVTLAIFAAVTLVVTSSFLTMVEMRDEARKSQQLNDELRMVLETMERELVLGSDYNVVCSAGVCTEIYFMTTTRSDFQGPYAVHYRLNGTTLEKAIAHPSSHDCNEALSFPPSSPCFLPVTSAGVEIKDIMFNITAADNVGDRVRPVITVALEGEYSEEAGGSRPLSYSGSYVSRGYMHIDDIPDLESGGGDVPPPDPSQDIEGPDWRLDFIRDDDCTVTPAQPLSLYTDTVIEYSTKADPWASTCNASYDSTLKVVDTVSFEFLVWDEGSGVDTIRWSNDLPSYSGDASGLPVIEPTSGTVPVNSGTCDDVSCAQRVIIGPIGLMPGQPNLISVAFKDNDGNSRSTRLAVDSLGTFIPFTDGLSMDGDLFCTNRGDYPNGPELWAHLTIDSNHNDDTQRDALIYRCEHNNFDSGECTAASADCTTEYLLGGANKPLSKTGNGCGFEKDGKNALWDGSVTEGRFYSYGIQVTYAGEVSDDVVQASFLANDGGRTNNSCSGIGADGIDACRQTNWCNDPANDESPPEPLPPAECVVEGYNCRSACTNDWVPAPVSYACYDGDVCCERVIYDEPDSECVIDGYTCRSSCTNDWVPVSGLDCGSGEVCCTLDPTPPAPEPDTACSDQGHVCRTACDTGWSTVALACDGGDVCCAWDGLPAPTTELTDLDASDHFTVGVLETDDVYWSNTVTFDIDGTANTVDLKLVNNGGAGGVTPYCNGPTGLPGSIDCYLGVVGDANDIGDEFELRFEARDDDGNTTTIEVELEILLKNISWTD